MCLNGGGSPKLFDTGCVCPASPRHGTACHPGPAPPLRPERGCPGSPGLPQRPLSLPAGAPAPCRDCRVRGPSHTPSPAQGWPRSARRTSSGARTSAASPRCGDATRTTTARTTATRTAAVSGRRAGRGARAGGTPCSARTWLSCRPAACGDLTPPPPGAASLGAAWPSDPAGSCAAGGPPGGGGGPGAPWPGGGTPSGPRGGAGTVGERMRLALRGSPASYHAASGAPAAAPWKMRGFFKVPHSSRPSRAALLTRFFFCE